MDTSLYQSIKLTISSSLNLSKDALHIHIGLMVFFLAVLIWKKGRIGLASLMSVVFVAFAMEAFDLFDDFRSFGYLRWSASTHDIVNTMLWPVIITVAVRFRLSPRSGN